MTGARCLREYPSGCPPPAAIAPTRPPLKPGATLFYLPQYPLSREAAAERDKFVETRLKYGVDEQGRAHAQVPVFTIPKPDTTDRRVLFDDSAGSSLNMVKVGLQLPRHLELQSFLRDAKILSSIDLASFFMTIRIVPEERDHWTYDGGMHGRVRNKRLVQGNSESPAIAQAFLTHVFHDMPELRGKWLVYIDNIYIKGITTNRKTHISDLGVLARGLAKYNLLMNLRKSIFLGTQDISVLGVDWSVGGAWGVPDYRAADLLKLPQPQTAKEIQRLCGGVNAISAHLPWSQVLLAPFYEMTERKD